MTAARLAALGVAAAGTPDRSALEVRLLLNLAAAVGEQEEARRLVRGLRGASGAGHVAFTLAAHMHARTQDDFYPPGRVHVGAVVIPAILAVGGGEVAPAMAAGYEVLAAISEAYAPIAQDRGLRPTGVFGPLGAAVAAGVALGLRDEELAAAIALASAVSGGTNQSWLDGTDEWLLEVAVAARAGVEAALMARAGVPAARRAIEGRAGWAAALFGDEDAAKLTQVLAGTTRRAALVATKPYPVSGIAQVPTTLAVQAGRGAESGRLPLEIEVRMSPRELAYPGSANRGPFVSRSDSLMSVARCVSLGYRTGRVPYRALTMPAGEEESALVDLVRLVPDDALGETEATLRAVDADGAVRTFQGHGDELLYPKAAEVFNGLDGVAERSEAAVADVESLAALVLGGADAATMASSVLEMVGRARED